MKICEIVLEDSVNPAQVDFDAHEEIRNIIMRDCQPYLTAVGENLKSALSRPMWRGIQPSDSVSVKLTEKYFTISPIRKDRMPMDTPGSIHSYIDSWFNRRMGIPFRSHSMFCTGRKIHAQAYGKAYIVIPIGNFSFCWSPLVEDMYESLRYYVNDLAKEDEDPWVPSNSIARIKYYMDSEDDVAGFLEDSDYRFNENLDKAIDSGHEIMIACNEAIIINPDKLNLNYFG